MPREIGWSQESNLLYYLSKELDRLIQVLSQISPSAGGVPTSRTITINGVAQDLSADRSWTIDTFESIEVTDGSTVFTTSINTPANNVTFGLTGINASMVFTINGNTCLVIEEGGDITLSQGFANMTDGFLHTPGASGVPTGVPSGNYPGQFPFYYDSSANRLYIYNGGWRSVALT